MAFRRSVKGDPRGPLCGMGICFECRVTIDGIPHSPSCQTLCRAGMEVRTDAEP
jgi:D-hydroxyproline dehydrogenase subunit gamma